MTERTYRVLSGLVAVLLFSSVVVTGAKLASGAAKPVYHVEGTFSAAGQGLLSGSDVKIHGVNIGKVSTIKLVDGRARIRLTIDKSDKIPVDAHAIIRPKTLFGEKFIDIDPGADEATGPFMRDGDTIKHTLGGFELERVLSDAYPILKAVKPEELGTILETLARGGEGTGPNVNHSLQNLAVIATSQAGNVKETEQFVDDLAALSDTLAAKADATAQGIHDAHDVLPVINDRTAEFTGALSDLATLSGDLADVLENNQPLLHKLVTEGGKPLAVIDAQLGQLPKTVVGLRQFLETLAESGTGIPYGSGTVAKIKVLVGGNTCQPALADCSTDLPAGYSVNHAPVLSGINAGNTVEPTAAPLHPPVKGVKGIRALLRSLLG
ncbi:MAG TPA: MlaD family protein [Acidimicrobiales bacterium]|nr:MlaD family protein [Acidimicrobiales bacterium]